MSKSKINEKIMEKAKALRLKKLTQEDIAKVLGLAQVTIHRMERAEFDASTYKYLVRVESNQQAQARKEKKRKHDIRVKMIHHIMKVQNYDWENGPMSARAAGSLIQSWADEALRIADGK